MCAVNPTHTPGLSISIAVSCDRHFFVECIHLPSGCDDLEYLTLGEYYMGCHPVRYYHDHYSGPMPPSVQIYTLGGEFIDIVSAAEFVNYFRLHSFPSRCAISAVNQAHEHVRKLAGSK